MVVSAPICLSKQAKMWEGKEERVILFQAKYLFRLFCATIIICIRDYILIKKSGKNIPTCANVGFSHTSWLNFPCGYVCLCQGLFWRCYYRKSLEYSAILVRAVCLEWKFLKERKASWVFISVWKISLNKLVSKCKARKDYVWGKSAKLLKLRGN